jgi:hypothetical protein
MKDDFVATAIVESTGNPGNEARMELLSAVIKQLENMTDSHGIILFPAGYFNAGQEDASTILQWVKDEIRDKLAEIERNIIVCVGVDGSIEGSLAKDQLAIAINKKGISAMARKFYPSKGEKGKINLAINHFFEEQGYPRIFSLNTRRYYIAVCYDVFGIKRLLLRNPDIDVVLNCIHNFYRVREGPSGVGLFTRHGLAGVAKQWDCPVFGTAVFVNRNVTKEWPSGIYWNHAGKNTKEFSFADNLVKDSGRQYCGIAGETVLIRIYRLNDCFGG